MTTSQEPTESVDEALGASTDVPPGGLRHRLRTNPATRLPYRLGVFLLGLAFVALGLALAVLPGPLTIPPILLGVWIWSTEFRWADRFLDRVRAQAHDAWDHAKRHPRSSAAFTIAGLVMAGVALWAIGRFDLVDEGRTALGV